MVISTIIIIILTIGFRGEGIQSFAASDLGLRCLPLCHIRTRGLCGLRDKNYLQFSIGLFIYVCFNQICLVMNSDS